MRLTLAVLLGLLFFSCRKESFTTSASALISFDTDTLHFDTLFTTTGSTTLGFKFFNQNAKGLHIASIQLKGGSASPFKINVNGVKGPIINNFDIGADDSAYVFVSVSIDQNSSQLPFIIRDSIEFNYNGNKKWVQLEAYGQNAHFLRGKIITANETWNNDLPYVILDGLEVAAAATLTINKGCKIYVHADAPIVIRGTLQVAGQKNERVLFTGDRLDDPYKNFPASWPGIYFLSASKDNSLQYANIINTYQALVVQGPSGNINPQLRASEVTIDNAYDAGLFAVNTRISAQNLLISNCGKNLVLVNGGDYQFTHCTVASFSNPFLRHKDPLLLLSNYIGTSPANPLLANFRNCIFWGDTASLVEKEIVVLKNGGSASVIFDHVLWNEKQVPANVTSVISPINQHPQFDSINTAKNFYDFRLKETSPAINKGVLTSVTLDLDGKARPVGLPDLGCYEEQ